MTPAIHSSTHCLGNAAGPSRSLRLRVWICRSHASAPLPVTPRGDSFPSRRCPGRPFDGSRFTAQFVAVTGCSGLRRALSDGRSRPANEFPERPL